jgi:hypothetical protein
VAQYSLILVLVQQQALYLPLLGRLLLKSGAITLLAGLGLVRRRSTLSWLRYHPVAV